MAKKLIELNDDEFHRDSMFDWDGNPRNVLCGTVFNYEQKRHVMYALINYAWNKEKDIDAMRDEFYIEVEKLPNREDQLNLYGELVERENYFIRELLKIEKLVNLFNEDKSREANNENYRDNALAYHNEILELKKICNAENVSSIYEVKK